MTLISVATEPEALLRSFLFHTIYESYDENHIHWLTNPEWSQTQERTPSAVGSLLPPALVEVAGDVLLARIFPLSSGSYKARKGIYLHICWIQKDFPQLPGRNVHRGSLASGTVVERQADRLLWLCPQRYGIRKDTSRARARATLQPKHTAARHDFHERNRSGVIWHRSVFLASIHDTVPPIF